jgi:carbon starvation protein
MIKKIFWGVICLVGAMAFAVVTGIWSPTEKVNALWIVTAAGCIYLITYRFYGAFLAAKVLVLSGDRQTPAFKMRDGIDYHPTNRYVLFGHHFAAIAGAGPLIGPMLAAQFGYLPGFLWMLIGASLGGAVHDMVVLTASVRRNGRSLAQIAKDEVGQIGGVAASFAILFIIIVALAGLGLAVVNALSHSPWGTFTIAMSIPIALFMGLYLYKIRYGKVGEVTLIGVSLLIAAVIYGHFIPGSPLENVFSLSRNTLILCMAMYGLIASILPVWMLLCPRDYLSTYMKIGTISLLAIGVIFIAPTIQMPALTKFIHGGGPVIPGKLFPFMFITIACGAISGFHALISSGTTPKMISSENDIQMIGFGAMLVEGFVSMMALIAACILLPGDYFAINTTLSFDQLASMGFPIDRVKELSEMVQVNVVHRPGGAVSLAVGMASILGGLPGMRGLMPYWYNFALMFEALFILTTVDTGTRVARFLVQEMGGFIYKPLARQGWYPGILISSLVVVGSWAFLIYTGTIKTIWPLFGVANQLLAAIALGVGTTVIIKESKLKYSLVTFIPMVFMFVTTFTASVELIISYWDKVGTEMTYGFAVLHSVLVGMMAILAMVALLNMIQRWYVLIIKKEGLAPRSPNGKVDYPNVAGETCQGDEIHL